MLVLRKDGGESYNLFTKPEHTIGRFGDLELTNDQSVSRQHAAISITIVNCRPKVILKDLQSKYGTYVNEGISGSKAISKSSNTVLKIGDRVRFGMQGNIWILEESSFVTCASGLSLEERNSLKTIVSKLNGNISSEWTDSCSYLTMDMLKTTVKAMCALGSVKPIVSMNYWRKIASTLSSRKETPIPHCDDFIPPIAEEKLKLNSSRISLKLNNGRKSLFKDIKFAVFGYNLLPDVLAMVETAGGKAFDGNNMNISEEELLSKKVIVVQENRMPTSAKCSRILKILNKHGLRSIKSSEICLSILHCSVQNYCNPAYDAQAIFLQPESHISINSDATVLAVDTQDNEMSQSTQYGETNSGNFCLAVDEKNILSDSDGDDMIASTDLSMIDDSNEPKLSKRILPFENTLKRKPDVPIESSSSSKNFKLDSWLINKKPVADTSNSKDSVSVFGNTNAAKKNTTLFNFRTDRKVTEKNCSSTSFSSKNESNMESSVSSIGNKPGTSRSANASFLAMNEKKVDNSRHGGNTKNDSLSNLFAGMNERRFTRSNFSLLASRENKKSSIMDSNKRKREDEVDGSHTKTKKCDLETSRLFSKETDEGKCIVLDSDEESSDSLTKKTSALRVSNCNSESQHIPVEIPTVMSLSQFVEVSNKPKAEETLNGTTVIQEVCKPIVHKVPLIKNSENISCRNVVGTETNFKRFRKSNVFFQNSTDANTTCQLTSCKERQQ